MKTIIAIVFLISTCTAAMSQDVKKQTEAAKKQSAITGQADKADAWQQKQRQQQHLTDSTQKPATTAKRHPKHCGKPRAAKP